LKFKKLTLLFISVFLLFLFSLSSLYSQRTKSSQNAGEQRYSQKGLKDNRYFFYFINSSVSNNGSKEEQQIYKEAIQRDIIAQILYLKFLFHDSFTEIKKSQKILINLYKKTIAKEILETKQLLNQFAPKIIRSKDYLARRYLRLGYRDITLAKQYMIMADNYRETLFSMRLYKYVRAIKKAKHGKKYAFLSIIESGMTPENRIPLSLLNFEELEKIISEKAVVMTLPINKQEKLSLLKLINKKEGLQKDYKFYKTRRKFDIAKQKKEELNKTETLLKKEKNKFVQKYPLFKKRSLLYTKYHFDTYYKTYGEKSFYEKIWENPQLDEIDDYKKYSEKN